MQPESQAAETLVLAAYLAHSAGKRLIGEKKAEGTMNKRTYYEKMWKSKITWLTQ